MQAETYSATAISLFGQIPELQKIPILHGQIHGKMGRTRRAIPSPAKEVMTMNKYSEEAQDAMDEYIEKKVEEAIDNLLSGMKIICQKCRKETNITFERDGCLYVEMADLQCGCDLAIWEKEERP